jgi:hypothetical protein
MFDPYHKWLGIPPDRRPPTLYQLLGIAPSETDPEVIEEAAIRQASHVRTYQTGQHGEACARLLSEIAEARRTLLDPARRRRYDARTRPASRRERSRVLPLDTAMPPADVELVAADSPALQVVLEPVADADLGMLLPPVTRHRRRRDSGHVLVALVATFLAVGLLALLLWRIWGDLNGPAPQTDDRSPPASASPRVLTVDRRLPVRATGEREARPRP